MSRARGSRWLAVALACALVAAGCGDDADTGSNVPALEPGATAPLAGDPATTAPTASPSGGDQPGDSGATQPPDVEVSDPPAAGPPATVSGNVDVGQLAPFILRPDQGSRIVIELSAQDSAAPGSGTLSHLTSVLRDVSGKQTSVDGPRAVAGPARSWTATELRQLADDVARTGQGDGTAVIRLLFLHGDLGGDDSVLGVAVRGDVAAIFIDQVRASAGVLGSPAPLEDAVTMHEVGHILGLVDLVLTTGRGDPEHPGHSRNSGSVMYWAVESSLVTQLLGAGPPRDFDDADRADLETIRGG
jgi:hypothetical protein